VARRAALLSFAGDEAGLTALREAEGARMAGGPFAEAFALITAARMAGISDLSRIRQEVELARSLPARLDASCGGSAAIACSVAGASPRCCSRTASRQSVRWRWDGCRPPRRCGCWRRS
jgi:hypothetical protein